MANSKEVLERNNNFLELIKKVFEYKKTRIINKGKFFELFIRSNINLYK